jgi:hypothetical protein
MLRKLCASATCTTGRFFHVSPLSAGRAAADLRNRDNSIPSYKPIAEEHDSLVRATAPLMNGDLTKKWHQHGEREKEYEDRVASLLTKLFEQNDRIEAQNKELQGQNKDLFARIDDLKTQNKELFARDDRNQKKLDPLVRDRAKMVVGNTAVECLYKFKKAVGVHFENEKESYAVIAGLPDKIFQDENVTREIVQTWLRWALDRHRLAHPTSITISEFLDQLAFLDPQQSKTTAELTTSFMQTHLRQQEGFYIIGRKHKKVCRRR